MRKSSIPLQQLKASKVAGINRQLLEELEGLPNKTMPRQPAPQVMWMWGQLVAWSLANGVQVVQEHRFHPVRKWRFDFSLPDQKIGIEYDGIMSTKSRHTTLNGFTGDTEKINAAQALGWRVLRFTCKNYKKVINELEQVIESLK